MKSIVEEALSRAGAEQRLDEPLEVERDLEEVLMELRTEIAVIGCGGGGSNTVTRMWEEGINGARLIAINTDAQHLVRTRAD
ncbi:MAG TPA: cell division protein FtsZ, partial [Methanoculleus sp.]|nr:cell division protein FtsZ [Methanoculleus sp.]